MCYRLLDCDATSLVVMRWHARARRALALFLVFSWAPRAIDASSPITGFGIVKVDTSTGTFVDSTTGDIVRARGTNVYSLRYDQAGGESSRARVVSILNAISDLKLDVIRTWAFMDGDAEDYDGRSMQPSEGEFIEKNFVALDELLALCAARRIRLILTLTNYWDDYGGIQQYVEWARASGEYDVYRREDFFTSPRCRASFERFIKAILLRHNTIDNILYRDHPAIFSYQLINEPRIAGDAQGNVFHDWVSYFSSFIKRTEGSRHLVSVGTEGFFLSPSGGVTFNPFSGAERQGVDMSRLQDVMDVDYVTVHCWVDDWMDSDDESKYRFMQTWVRAHLDQSSSKPVVLEEFGKHRPLDVRDRFFRRVYELLREDGRNAARSGSLFWLFVPNEIEDYDGFSVYASDATTLSIVRDDATSFDDSSAPPIDAYAPPPPSSTPMTPPGEDDDIDDEDDDDVDFETIVAPVADAESSSFSYSCRMLTSNAYEAHATYGDYVSIELVLNTVNFTVDNVDIDFAGVQDTMAVTATRVRTSVGSSDMFTTTSYFTATRRLGEGGIYLDEGPIMFAMYFAPSSSSSNAFVTITKVTHGTRIVFDSAAPFVTDAFLRPYSSGNEQSNTVAYGDIAVLYVAFSEPVGIPKVLMNGRDAFVSVAKAHSANAFYAFVEITAETDALGSAVSFEVIEANDYAGNKCYTCSDGLSKRTTDESSLTVVAT